MVKGTRENPDFPKKNPLDPAYYHTSRGSYPLKHPKPAKTLEEVNQEFWLMFIAFNALLDRLDEIGLVEIDE